MKTFRFTRAIAGALLLGTALFGAPRAGAVVKVVATLPELAAITREVGGNKVSVYSIARPNRNYHSIEPRPSDVQRVARAGLVVRSGLGMDMWMDALMRAANNSALNVGGSRYVDASASIPRLDVPNTQITGASGDVHPGGNPHYYYDPIYGKFIARNILKGLIRVDSANADFYRANYKAFNAGIDARMKGWNASLAPFRGASVVTYHESFAYFLRRFGLREYGHLEPKPGLPPSASHLNALIGNMKRDKVRALVIESIYPTRSADLVARQTKQNFVVVPYSVGSPGVTSYFDLIDTLVSGFKKALS